ncbi:uncharacterized protein LOC121503586 [Xyrichtys novacula]|uniref:Uncharacterized protein LOC121503586 n=1 Tax=Xyrichtys novacula TaxID=13765 RepID=A0AAV1GS75_XYRNO|nr:uncharacterized protein LOC121503586 [Xyrichtys novacula]
MSSSWIALVMVAAIFISMVLLAAVCLDCRVKGPPVSISQAATSDVYISPPQTDSGSQRRKTSFTPTETESNPSYENQADVSDYINADSDQEDHGYIVVLPDGPTNPSRASTPSSDVQHDYENFPKTGEDRDYLNVEPLNFERSTPDLSAKSCSSSSSSDDEEDEGNYVNQPPMHCSPVHDGAQTEQLQ